MILCIDCGNTRLKWGLRSASDWAAMGILPTEDAGALPGCLPAATPRPPESIQDDDSDEEEEE